MQEWSALAGVVAALGVGVVSPGPSFVMVARTAVGASRSNGLAAAVGMGAAGMVFALAALLGLQTVLRSLPSVYRLLQLAGGAYLVYLGWAIWRSAARALVVPDAPRVAAPRWRRSLALGWVTQLSNPKTAIVYASVFAAFLPPHPGVAFGAALTLSVFVIETGWYAVVALALSSAGPRRVYLRYKTGLDRTAGGVMALLGLRLVLCGPRI